MGWGSITIDTPRAAEEPATRGCVFRRAEPRPDSENRMDQRQGDEALPRAARSASFSEAKRKGIMATKSDCAE